MTATLFYLLHIFVHSLAEYIGVLNNCTAPIEVMFERTEGTIATYDTTTFLDVLLAARERMEYTHIPTEGALDFVVTEFGGSSSDTGSRFDFYAHHHHHNHHRQATFDIEFEEFEMPISITAEKEIFYANVPFPNNTISCVDKHCKRRNYLGIPQNPYAAAGRGNFNITIC